MIQKLKIFQSDSFDPYHNLAVEQHLMETVPADCCILYLWENANTVVIGRNQNAWKECRTTLLEQEGGHLARRLSGGGAVFHDLGNLNFTFLVPTDAYDLDLQLSVILEACRSLGIQAEKSGRNDVLVEGRKFSGNAFYRNGQRSYHHGTLMIDVDKEKLGRYLSPSKAKLEAKGVDSVRSRVVNLREFAENLTCDEMKIQMREAFSRVYGLPAQELRPEDLDLSVVEALRARNAGWDWLYGTKLPFTFACEERFDWGGVQVQLQVEEGVVKEVKVYSDSMDWSVAGCLEKALSGCRFALTPLKERICAEFAPEDGISKDLCRMMEEQQL